MSVRQQLDDALLVGRRRAAEDAVARGRREQVLAPPFSRRRVVGKKRVALPGALVALQNTCAQINQ